MSYPMHALRSIALHDFDSIRQPAEGDSLSAEDPAALIMTDFSQTAPLTLTRDVALDAAHVAMRDRYVRSALITDSHGHFVGLLTLADINSHRVLALATGRGQTRADLTAGDLMTPRNSLSGITLQTLGHSRIGDCLNTLERDGRQHLLITDPLKGDICGIISASDIARALHRPVEIPRIAETFGQVVTALHG